MIPKLVQPEVSPEKPLFTRNLGYSTLDFGDLGADGILVVSLTAIG